MTADARPTIQDDAYSLDVLACDYQQRPKDAPSFFDLEGAVRGVRRDDRSLVIDFDPAEAERVAALVDAERQCCTTIGWELETSPSPQLRITATPAQLDVFEGFLPR